MKAIVQNGYGSPDVFELKEIVKPVVGKDNDVLVRVRAAALHAGDYLIMRGTPYLVRLLPMGFFYQIAAMEVWVILSRRLCCRRLCARRYAW